VGRRLGSVSRGQLLRSVFLAGSCLGSVSHGQLLRSGRRLRSGRCKAQILPSSTCKASVGERERERQMKRAELGLLEVLGLVVNAGGGELCRGELRILLFSIFGAITVMFFCT
jgi:hypothetical protein